MTEIINSYRFINIGFSYRKKISNWLVFHLLHVDKAIPLENFIYGLKLEKVSVLASPRHLCKLKQTLQTFTERRVSID